MFSTSHVFISNNTMIDGDLICLDHVSIYMYMQETGLGFHFCQKVENICKVVFNVIGIFI